MEMCFMLDDPILDYHFSKAEAFNINTNANFGSSVHTLGTRALHLQMEHKSHSFLVWVRDLIGFEKKKKTPKNRMVGDLKKKKILNNLTSK